MSDNSISLEQGIQILSRAFSQLRGNPSGWEDKGNLPPAGGTVTMPGNTRPKGDPGAETPTNPGMGGPSVPGDPPGWSPRTYAYGDMGSAKIGAHASVITDEQAHAWQMLMLATGQDGSTVGKGGVVHNEPLRDKHGNLVPQPGATRGTYQWSRPSGDYFNGMQGDPNMQNPLAVPFNGFAQGFSGEQDEGTPGYVAPAPYGYSTDGRPLQYAGQSDAEAAKIPISKYAPGREYGPTVNKYKPTQAESDAQSHDKRMN